MSNSVRPRPNVSDTSRGASNEIWGRFPIDDIQDGVIDGYYRHYEFNEFRLSADVNAAEAYWADGYNVFGSAGASIARYDDVGGGITVGSDGDNEGLWIRDAAPKYQIGRSNGAFALEASIQTSTITDAKHNLFCGLMDSSAVSATVPITAAGALADVNLVGFWRSEAASNGAILQTAYKADGVAAVTVQASAFALTAATWTKIGFMFEPFGDLAGSYALSFYVNGVRMTSSKLIPSASGTDFPNDVRLGFVFGVLNATATTPGTSSIRWVRTCQFSNQSRS
jgi:hypothetical protein